MTERLYDDDPLTPEERGEFKADLIAFCERELDFLGDIRGLDALYAGGTSLLWIEGLSRRIGAEGSLTVLDVDQDGLELAQERLGEAELDAGVRFVLGDIFDMPWDLGTFDLVYSSGVFHELDTRTESGEDALMYLASVARAGGRVATSDWVDTGEEPPPVDLEWERLEAKAAHELNGTRLYGIGSPERLITLHEAVLHDVRWRVSPPYPLRHLDKVMLSEPDEPAEYATLSNDARRRLLARRKALKERIWREGYGGPATLYAETRFP